MGRSSLFYRECRANDFNWRVRKVYNWLGQMEVMIEVEGLEGCVAFGDDVKEVKRELSYAFSLWVREHGESQLPDVKEGAHVIYLEEPMSHAEFDYINASLQHLK